MAAVSSQVLQSILTEALLHWVHYSITKEVSPQIWLRLLLNNVSIVHLHKVIIVHKEVPIVYHLPPGLDSDSIASGMVVPVTSQLEEGVDGEVVNVVHDLVSLDEVTPHTSIL